MLALCLCALLQAPPADRAGGAASSWEELRALLVRQRQDERARPADVAARLAALEPAPTAALFELVTGAGIEALYGVPEGQPEPLFLCSPDELPQVALLALSRLPPAGVLAHLRAIEAGQPERDVRVAEVRVLGVLASAQALPQILELAQAFGDELMQRPVRAPLIESLASILRADPGSYASLKEALPGLPAELRQLLAEAAQRDGQPAGVELLADFLDGEPELELLALSALTALELSRPWRVHLDLHPLLLQRLTDADARVRRAALRALGELRDSRAVGPLIVALGDPDPEVARVAQWALAAISARAPCHTVAEWQDWHQRELAWWNGEGARLREELASGAPTRRIEALRQLVARPFGRELVAGDLVAQLPSLEPPQQVLTCRSLAQLGSRSAVPALVDLLFESGPEVRLAAGQALRELTGQDLAAEPRLWEAYAFE